MIWGRGGCDGMVIGFTSMQSVPITTQVVRLNPANGEVYLIQHYVFVSDLQTVIGFLHQLNWPPRNNWNIIESCVRHNKTSSSYVTSISMSHLKGHTKTG